MRMAFLYVAEIIEGVVLHGVEKYQVCGSERRRQCRQNLREISVVGTKAVADVNQVGSSERQAFLIAPPSASFGGELVSDGLANDVRIGRNRLDAINVVVARQTCGLVGGIDCRCCGVGSGSPDR